MNPKCSNDNLEEFTSDGEFMDAYVELLKQSITLLWNVLELEYYSSNNEPRELSRDEAIIAGNLNRLVKLNMSFLQNICEHKLEVVFILLRSIGETYVNIRYLLSDSEGNVKHNYVKYSLITEKQMWGKIKENIEERGGESAHIEERMTRSIEDSFESSDFELDEVRRSSKWKTLSKRVEAINHDRFYDFFYGLSSHIVHGNWQSLLFLDLDRSEDGFKVKADRISAKPQVIDAAILMNLEVVREFPFTNEEEGLLLIGQVETLEDYQLSLVEAHERYLMK